MGSSVVEEAGSPLARLYAEGLGMPCSFRLERDFTLGLSVQTHGVNLFDDFSGILVHDKLVLVIGAFDIAIGSKGTVCGVSFRLFCNCN